MIRALIRFVDGVCAIPRFVPSSELRYETWQQSFDELNAQLAAEREAHEQTRIELGLEKAAHDVANQAELRAEQLLSAARADLESLTRWNLQSEKPCPVDPDIDVSLLTARYGICLDKVSTMIATDSWRFTPESLAAWKAREGERDV